MGRHLASAAALALAFVGCAGELNRPVRPAEGDLVEGLWVAYNYGCARGCDDIRRGDRLLEIDGVSVSSGAEFDRFDLADGAPHRIVGRRLRSDEPFEVTIEATPVADLPPLTGVGPLRVAGSAALDRAPSWAREVLFGHAIPALRFYREEPPVGFVDGRELLGRGLVAVLWVYSGPLPERIYWQELAPKVYAHLQAWVSRLLAAGVDVGFVVAHNTSPETRAELRTYAGAPDPGYVPIYQLSSRSGDPNTVGLERGGADLREALKLGGLPEPVILIFDDRGIVRWHSSGFPLGVADTIEAALRFAEADLQDRPADPEVELVPQAQPLSARAAMQ
ncbi:MAG: hypothetical protein R3A79_25380 [Nannocystaceae bacterium]